MDPSTTKVNIKCHFCAKLFFRKLRWVKDNERLKLNNFCSKECGYKSRKTGKILTCENKTCRDEFYKVKNQITPHNYCSRSCAAIVNNSGRAKFKICKNCGERFRGENSFYCSQKCHFVSRGYTTEDIIREIIRLSKKLKRVPARREGERFFHAAYRVFGSWNKAILAAGLQPNRSHDHRMYKRIRTKAADGHICDSVSEALVDNWLTQNKIPHVRDYPYPSSNHKADWASPDGKIFVEYFGLAKDSPRYDRDVRRKKILCQKYKIKLIDIYPKDLYPNRNLNAKLPALTTGL